MSRHQSPRAVGHSASPPDIPAGGRGIEESAWRVWMRDLGRRQRRLREFLGLSQEQLARLAGVSQGALSRLETAKGLATPLLIILKINAVLARELRKLDPALVSTELRDAIELQAALSPSGDALGFKDLPLAQDDRIEELVRLYRGTPERHRAGLLSVVRAMALGLSKTLPLVLAGLIA
ncbi:MAG: helix-turn-helix transcriptional regulator [Deltaproteobacteria bacterium]|nr:MAG: helix-turn-helix transcriptional regulator [Deltaproteobacteria bacterium]